MRKTIVTLLLLASLGGCAMTPEEQVQWQRAMGGLQNVGNQMMYIDAMQRASTPQFTTCQPFGNGISCTEW